MEKLIGRKYECEELSRVMASSRSEFVILYGRRRIGKTFLVRSFFEDRYDFRALMRVTLLSNGKLQMYFPPEKTKTADIFVYAYNQPRETGFSWYEPTLNGLIFHPEAKTGQEAVKKYYLFPYIC